MYILIHKEKYSLILLNVNILNTLSGYNGMFCACFIIGFWGYYIVGKFPIMRWHMNKIGSEKRKILKANKSEKN